MADTNTKKVMYELQGDDTGLIRTINSALKKIDALDAKLSRIASRRDISAVKEGETRDAIKRISAIMSSLNALDKMRTQLAAIDIRLLTKDQLALIKTAVAEINAMSKNLGKAADAGSVTQETLTNTSKRINELRKAFRLSNIELEQTSSNTNRMNASFEASTQIAADFRHAVSRLAATLRRIAGVIRTTYRISSELFALAADFGETMNKFNVVAGNTSEQLNEFATSMHNAFGIDISDIYDATASFKSISNSIGLADDKAVIFSTTLSKLAVDLSSLYNTPVEQAMNALTSGLHGQLRPLKNYNIYLYETNLQQTTLAYGITKNVSAMNESERVLLRYLSVLQQSNEAQGDMARTLKSAANQMKITQAQLTQVKRSLGQIVTVIVMVALPAINVIFAALAKVAEFIAQTLGYSLEDFTVGVSNALEDGEDSIEDYSDALNGLLAPLDEINTANKGTNSLEDVLAIDPAILNALATYDNLMGSISNNIGSVSDAISQGLEGTLIVDMIQLAAGALKVFGRAIDFVVEHWEAFEPVVKTLINLLSIFLGITVVKTFIGWGTAIVGLVAKLKAFAITVPLATKTINGALLTTSSAVSGLTLALGALSFAASYALFSTFFDQFDSQTRKTIGTISLLISLLGAATIAWAAYHGAMTLGVAIPALAASIGVAAASARAALPQMATGGVVSSPTVAMIGEGKYDEAVVPLGNSPQFKSMKESIADEVANRVIGRSSLSAGEQKYIILNVNGKEFARAILPDMATVAPQVGVTIKR